jgi:hypothetical protein
MDLRDFFPTAKFKRFFRMFRDDFGFGTDVASVLTSLTTFRGHLPQGAPSSPALANALLTARVDRPIEILASERGVEPTRFIDDFTFSGPRSREMINDVAVLASGVGLPVWRKKSKLKITPNHRPQTVTGLGVNSTRGPSVGRARVDQVRAAIHQLPRVPKLDQPHAIASIAGRIAHVRQSNKGAAARLDRWFAAARLACDSQPTSPQS